MSGYRQRRVAAQNRIRQPRVNFQPARPAYRPKQKPGSSADIHISICTTGGPLDDDDRRFIEQAVEHIAAGRAS